MQTVCFHNALTDELLPLKFRNNDGKSHETAES
jgi:hypothetical protein